MAALPLSQYGSTYSGAFTNLVFFTQAPHYAPPCPASTPSANDENLGRHCTQPRRKEMKMKMTIEVKMKTKIKKKRNQNPNLYEEEIHLAIGIQWVVAHIWPNNADIFFGASVLVLRCV
ncbi:hypothetical protein J1N35_008144 [Gossypium stocksii]|uniref:Uncharacterized protein n=1 Tax=Gossypium stocksii TaxID=47602 RepID=A0A9D4AGC7_9ROSI|nr:hypothetical protein J1N35_008144 [Gossypium stocksii]